MAATKTIRAAAVQAEPAWFDLAGAVTKTCSLITEAAGQGASIICFPECWIPGYPAWIWTRPVDFTLNVSYIKNALTIPSPELNTICECARRNKMTVALGFAENDHDSLYIAQAIIGPDGDVKTKRRKMKPTHMERTVFGEASGQVFDTVTDIEGIGRVGALSCWEHIQPLLKMATYAEREVIHCAAWPSLTPHSGNGPDLWSMSAEGCQNLSRTYAIESQTYVLHSTGLMGEKGVAAMNTSQGPLMSAPGGGNAAIFGPDGRKLTEDVDSTKDAIVYANLDMDEITRIKMFADPMGHYSRPDLMWLGTNKEVKKMLNVNAALAEAITPMTPPSGEESGK